MAFILIWRTIIFCIKKSKKISKTIILISGLLSTKLQVRVKCQNLYNEEKDIFKQVRFYCGETFCSNINSPYEEYYLLISGLGPFKLIIIGDINKYSACIFLQ